MALSFSQKAGWGLADMGVVVFVIVKQLLVLAFLTNYLGVPVAWAGLLTTVVLVFDIITDPLIGYLSDRTSGRFGRRAPWMVAGAVIMSGGMIGLFAAAPDATPLRSLLWVGAFFTVATVGFTMIAIPYGAMAGEMTQDPKERSVITGWRMGFASIGILIGGAVIPAIAGQSAAGHLKAALYVAPVIILSVWISVFATRKAPRLERTEDLGVRAAFGTVFSNQPFVILFLLYGLMTLGVTVITAGLPFAATYLMAIESNDPLAGIGRTLGILSTMFAAFVVGALASQPAWVLISGRIGKLFALVLGLALYIALLIVIYNALPSTSLTAMAGLFVLAGFTNGSYQQIPWAMYPDLMDLTRQQTGASIEGSFAAVWLFGQKVASALAPGLVGLLLGLFGWQSSRDGGAAQSDAALEALRLVVTTVPAALLALSIIGLLLLYRPSLARTTETA